MRVTISQPLFLALNLGIGFADERSFEHSSVDTVTIRNVL